MGQVDDEHIFYLMSRGLTREQAETMIVKGFLEPIISNFVDEQLKEKVRGHIER